MTAVNGGANRPGDNASMDLRLFKNLLIATLLTAGLAHTASADIWKWTDVHGKIHFVNTLKPIYTWVEDGKVFFADKPGHEDAVSVELVWHSTGDDVEAAAEEEKRKAHDKWAYVGETPEERLERENAEKYYCNRAKEIYESYKQAPRLYKTNDAGVREYLSDEEAAQTLAETKARVAELCDY